MSEKKAQVLIVDDQEGIRELLGNLLANQGYNLSFAANGEEALKKASELAPDLIILDVMMPKMGGFEVCRRLRADPTLAAIPVVMLTALDDHNSRLEGFEAGADDFITKPFNWIELQARVRTIVQLNRFRQLHAERQKFEWVVEKAEDGYLIIAHDAHILYANTQARRYLDIADGDDALNTTFLELVANNYHCEPNQSWDNWPNQIDEKVPTYLIKPETETSNSLWLQVDQTQIVTGPQEEYLIHLRDVTTNVMAERLVWTFQGQVSHKLRTPVGALTGFLNLLKGENPTFSQSEQLYFNSACDSAIHLQNEIQRILYYQETYHLLQSEQKQCDLNTVINLIDTIKDSLELEKVATIYDDTLDLNNTRLPLSPRIVEVILHQLMENAKKFHPQHTPTLEVKIDKVAAGLQIQLCDDGLTLSPSQLHKMWLPYYQAEKYFTGQVVGMGLGLSTVAALLWEVGGTYRAFNKTDAPGVVIELTVPLATPPSKKSYFELE